MFSPVSSPNFFKLYTVTNCLSEIFSCTFDCICNVFYWFTFFEKSCERCYHDTLFLTKYEAIWNKLMRNILLPHLLASFSVNKVGDLGHIKMTGQDPILPSPFPIGEIGMATLGAVGFEISELWYLQTHQKQTVTIDVETAAMVQRSHQYLKHMDGTEFKLWDPLSGFYRTKDNRWIQLHCNFPHHRQGVVNVLGCTDEKTAVANTIQNNWNAEKLEAVLSSLGLCASMVRTESEWAEHPQAKAIAALPLIEIIKVEDSPKELLPRLSRPLSGIKVLDLTRVIAGPVCARTFAEHGATILHITSPKLPFIAPLVIDTGHGKFSAQLDLTESNDRERLHDLIKSADIFLQAYRPGGLNKKGFSLDNVVKTRPGIIYIDLSAYSHAGPWSERRGYDTLVQAATGIVHTQSSDDDHPQHLPAQTLDYVAGYLAAFGALEALRRREFYGGSYHVRTSLAQVAFWLTHLPRVINYSQCKIPTQKEVFKFLTRTETAFGEIEHFSPVIKLSKTPAFWQRPTAPLGSDKAEWPENFLKARN